MDGEKRRRRRRRAASGFSVHGKPGNPGGCRCSYCVIIEYVLSPCRWWGRLIVVKFSFIEEVFWS